MPVRAKDEAVADEDGGGEAHFAIEEDIVVVQLGTQVASGSFQ